MAGLVPYNKNRMALRPNGFEDLYNLLDDFFHDSFPAPKNLVKDSFKLDIQENDKEYLVEAELPGIKKEEINVDLNDGRLTISVKREEKIEEQKKNYIHRERRMSSMQRSIYLTDAAEDSITAKLEEGMLKINVPKALKTEKTRKITID